MGPRRLQRDRMRERGAHAEAIRVRHGTLGLRLLLLERADPGGEHALTVGLDEAEFLALVAALGRDPHAQAFEPEAVDRLQNRTPS